MDFPVKVGENVNQISFACNKTPGGNQKAENSEKKCRFFLLPENKYADVINAHNQDTAKQKEIDIPDDLEIIITKFINLHPKYNNLNEFALAAFEYFLKNEEFLQSKIPALDKIK